MDPVRNPFAPGAGTPPPELAGRSALLEQVGVAIERIKLGRHAKSVLMVGLRGVGKTVLLDRMLGDASIAGAEAVRIEAPEDRSLPSMLAPELRLALLRLSQRERAKDTARKALRALAGFAKGLKVKYADIEVGIDYEPEPGLADNGNLETDLVALLTAAGKAAQSAESALVIAIDEMQYVGEEELAALVLALHRTSQQMVPVVLIGAGWPQLRGHMGRAKSYAERLFDFPTVGSLDPDAARDAIKKPIEAEEADIEELALAKIVTVTAGYPYFLQEWGKSAWDVSEGPTITVSDVEAASQVAQGELDEGFFRVRFDRLTPAEKRYLRAMAELGEGPHRSGDVASELEKEVTALAPTRSSLIRKGMVYSPSHGDTAFTVPLFNEFMRRIMPASDWRA